MRTETERKAEAFVIEAAGCIALTLGMRDAEAAELRERVQRAFEEGGEDEKSEAA